MVNMSGLARGFVPEPLSPVHGLRYFVDAFPGAHAPGFTLSPAPQARASFPSQWEGIEGRALGRAPSCQYHLRSATDSEITPDKRIEPTWEEFRAGRDPVMEW